MFFRDRILRFGENMPQSLKRFLSNFNVVAIQNSLDGFSNTLYVRNNSKTSRWFPYPVQGNLETSVYRKPTHTDKYLAFDSHHPICHKKSVAKTLLRRADCLPSSLDSKAEERRYVSNVLKANGYTKTFLRNCQKPVTNSNALDEREPATGFAVIPYIQGVTNQLILQQMNSLFQDRITSIFQRSNS